MKCHQKVTIRLVRATILLVSLALGLAAGLSADDTNPDGFPLFGWGSTVEEVMAELGPPDFQAASILMYATETNTATGQIEADLTLWFRSDSLFFASYAFGTDLVPRDQLAAEFESISDQLRLSFDEPSSRSAETDAFTTEVWNLVGLDIEHTLILDPDRIEHVVNFTASQP